MVAPWKTITKTLTKLQKYRDTQPICLWNKKILPECLKKPNNFNTCQIDITSFRSKVCFVSTLFYSIYITWTKPSSTVSHMRTLLIKITRHCLLTKALSFESRSHINLRFICMLLACVTYKGKKGPPQQQQQQKCTTAIRQPTQIVCLPKNHLYVAPPKSFVS
jgi:hypothetical protein